MVRKVFVNSKNIIWFNTHGSQIAKKSNILVPVLTSFEAENIYLNFEQRPQKSYLCK
jgi:NADH dehydrogenase/NADH:ubiquinone oxidoreductase subunit G